MKSFRLFGVKFTKVKYIDSGHYVQKSELFPKSLKYFIPEKRIFISSSNEICEVIRLKYIKTPIKKLDLVARQDWSHSCLTKSVKFLLEQIKLGKCKIFYNYEDLEKHLDKIALLR